MAIRSLALAVNALWSLGMDPNVNEAKRPHLRRDAVTVADVLIGLFPDEAIADAGQLARDWREVQGQEPTTAEVQDVYIAVVHYLVPLVDPHAPPWAPGDLHAS
jgi:hypothetical protein